MKQITGICSRYQCTGEVAAGRKKCQRCLDTGARWARERRKQKGKCGRCFKRVQGKKATCRTCLGDIAARKVELIAEGRCGKCGAPQDSQYKHCLKCRKKFRAANKRKSNVTVTLR